MKVLLGTPIHELKDYSMERWLECVSKLKHPFDLLMVDNSPGTAYMEKVRSYCAKYAITNYKLMHLEISQEQGVDERVAKCREIIRNEILNGNYDAWFTLECDQIVPPDALEKLIELMNTGDFVMINHNSWAREIPTEPNTDFGCSLIKREALEKYGFLLEYGKVNDPLMPDCWHGGESWFKKRVRMGGGKYLEVFGVIDPIYHLDS